MIRQKCINQLFHHDLSREELIGEAYDYGYQEGIAELKADVVRICNAGKNNTISKKNVIETLLGIVERYKEV